MLGVTVIHIDRAAFMIMNVLGSLRITVMNTQMVALWYLILILCGSTLFNVTALLMDYQIQELI